VGAHLGWEKATAAAKLFTRSNHDLVVTLTAYSASVLVAEGTAEMLVTVPAGPAFFVRQSGLVDGLLCGPWGRHG
jgi:hypothetical protein